MLVQTHQKKIQQKNRESGQATIEFALSMVLLMGFILFIVQLSLVFGFANYTQYATYMSARAYLSAGPTQGDQLERSQDVLRNMVKGGAGRGGQDRFPSIAKGEGGSPDISGAEWDPSPYNRKTNFSWLEGIRYTFKSRIFLLPLGRRSAPKGANSVTLISESWLGRDSSYEECMNEMSKKGIIDNGC